MSVITDEMDRLKGISLRKFEELSNLDINPERHNADKMFFSLGYAYGMDDARKIQENIKVLAEEARAEMERQ